MCVWGGRVHVCMHTCVRAEGRRQLMGVNSPQHVGPEHQTQVLRLGGKSFTH